VFPYINTEISLELVPKLVDADWKALIPQVGLRTALRKAAGELAEHGNSAIEAELAALRKTKAELVEQEDQQRQVVDRYQEQIQMAKSRLSAKTSELLEVQNQSNAVMSQAQEIDTKTTSLVMELEQLKSQKVTLEAEKKKVAEERDQAQLEARALSNFSGMV